MMKAFLLIVASYVSDATNTQFIHYLFMTGNYVFTHIARTKSIISVMLIIGKLQMSLIAKSEHFLRLPHMAGIAHCK